MTNKLSNEYVDTLPSGVYADIPKAVWAAVAISLATTGGERLEEALSEVLDEWLALHLNGIVPQEVPHRLWKRVQVTE